jgi:hypothetical protein
MRHGCVTLGQCRPLRGSDRLPDKNGHSWLDWVIPIGAVLVICASLASAIRESDIRLGGNRSDLLKAYSPKPNRSVQ